MGARVKGRKQMSVNTYHTVMGILGDVKPLIDVYRKYPAREEEATVRILKSIFSLELDYVGIVVKDGRFVESFVKGMGKGRMKILQKLLLTVDKGYYETIDFKID